jgi:hypothetical protein
LPERQARTFNDRKLRYLEIRLWISLTNGKEEYIPESYLNRPVEFAGARLRSGDKQQTSSRLSPESLLGPAFCLCDYFLTTPFEPNKNGMRFAKPGKCWREMKSESI